MRLINRKISMVVLLIVLSACTTIAPFSQTAYEQATSIKAEALVLMDKATEQYSNHKVEVAALRLEVEKAYEYSKGRPKNEVSTAQWEIIRNPDRNSLGGFLNRWETSGTLARPFINEAKKLVSDGFDTVIGLESGKIRPDQMTTK